jgi:hypothetical protein
MGGPCPALVNWAWAGLVQSLSNGRGRALSSPVGPLQTRRGLRRTLSGRRRRVFAEDAWLGRLGYLRRAERVAVGSAFALDARRCGWWR